MQNQDKITTVVTAFEQWRCNRNGRQAPTPTTLREQAVSLLNHYSSSKITSALSISGSQLKQWRGTLETVEEAPHFVHLPIQSPLAQPPLNVELRFISGDSMCLSGAVDSGMLVSLIGAMKS